MVIIHVITFAAYLVSVIIYYVFDELYVTNDWSEKRETQFYISRTSSFLLLVLVEGVLIYIFWGLSRNWIEFEETNSEYDR